MRRLAKIVIKAHPKSSVSSVRMPVIVTGVLQATETNSACAKLVIWRLVLIATLSRAFARSAEKVSIWLVRLALVHLAQRLANLARARTHANSAMQACM